MHKTDEAVCLNMLEAVNKILEISKGFNLQTDFVKDYIRFDATMMNFVVIGEMANKLSLTFKDEYKDIEWRRISDLRNIIAHDYFGIDDKEIWQIIKNKLPELKAYLVKILGV